MPVSDLFSKPNNGVLASPATLAAAKATGDDTVDISIATGWPVDATDGPVHIKIFKTEPDPENDGEFREVEGTVTDWKAALTGTTLSDMQLTGGSNQPYELGDSCIIYPTAGWGNDLVNGLLVSHKANGKLKTDAVKEALNTGSSDDGGWNILATAPEVTAINGNNSVDIRFPGVNYTDRLSKGMRLKIPRNVAPQTQVTSLNGTTQYWSKTSPVGMTFTDDFSAGAWVYITNVNPGTNQVIMSRYNGTSGWSLQIDGEGKALLCGWNGGSSNTSYVISRQSIPLGRLTHISAQLDMSAFSVSPTTSYVMIDGVDAPSTVIRSGTNPTALIQAGNLEIGTRAGGTQPFTGTISQAWVSSGKITQANVRSFMYSGITPAVISAYNIISAYSFDGTANDLNTTTANNLTAQAAAGYVTDSPFNPNAFAIIATPPVFSGGNTIMTVQAANGYSIPNEALGIASSSTNSTPYGFPASKDRFKIALLMFGDIAQIVTTGQWVNIGGMKMTVPAGEWTVGFSLNARQLQTTSSGIEYRSGIGLSSTTGIMGSMVESMNSVGHQDHIALLAREIEVTATAATPYYLNMWCVAGSGTITLYTNFNNGQGVFYADFGLL